MTISLRWITFLMMAIFIAGVDAVYAEGTDGIPLLESHTAPIEKTAPVNLPIDIPARPAPTLEESLAVKSARKGDPVFIRIFKEEKDLEVWIRKGKRYTLIKTYPICTWSGELGPKLKEGDYQSPEGFYEVGRRQLNPNSTFHLSFNLGFPNAYDRAHNRTGSYLMVHGNCVSIGCYAMTDSGIEEIYGLLRAALRGGQRRVPVHLFPFRMSAANIDRYSGHKWIDFWWNLKKGYDVFEATLLPPRVRVSKKTYVFEPMPHSISQAIHLKN